MPEAYTHIRIARAARQVSGVSLSAAAPYEMGANGPDPLFAYQVLSPHKTCPLPALASRMHAEQCGRFLRVMIFTAATPAQRCYTMGFLTHYAADSVLHPYVAFQTGEDGQFRMPEGHGFCEVAMDSMFRQQDCGSAGVPADEVAPRLAPQELAEISQLLHDAILRVYGQEAPHEALADAFHDFHSLHRVFYSPRGGMRALVRLAERLVLRRPGWGLSHMTPAVWPQEGFAARWTNPFTGAVRQAGPQRLCAEAAQLAAGYLKAASAYWEGRSIKQALAMSIGDRSYVTGLLSEPAPRGAEALP